MPSTYTVNLGIEKPATGEQSGTWGDTTNVNFDILDQAINGAERVTLSSAGSSGSPNALIITNGAASDGRNKWIEFYSSGDLGGDVFVQLQPNDAEKIVFVRNSLAGSRSVLLFQGTYNSGRDLEIPAGVDMVVKFDGGGASAATVTDVYTKLRATEITTPTLTAGTADINGGTIDNSVIGGSTAAAVTGTTVVANTSLNIAGDGATVTGIKDEDDMSSNSPTKLATQQSIKAYVDSQVGTVDTWAEVLANGATSGSTNPEVTAGQALKTDTINETSAGSGVTIDSVLLKDDVVNATDVETSSISANDGTAAATIANTTGNFTITNFISNSVDIGGGAIDGTVIGGTTPAASSFTTGSFTGNATFADNAKVIFGAGSDLQLFHDGNDSYIKDEGTGVLFIRGSGSVRIQGINGENGITLSENGAVDLYHDNALKLATTSGGISVTGSVTADGLTVQTTGSTTAVLTLNNADGNGTLSQINLGYTADPDHGNIQYTGDMIFTAAAAERMRINSVGTTSIKTDGTTQLILNRADASIQATNQVAQILVTGDDPSASQSGAAISFIAGDAWATNSYPTNITFSNDLSGTLTERMRIDASGNVGIGVSDPSPYYANELVVAHGTEGGITLVGAAGTATGYLMFADGTTGNESYRGYIGYSHSTPDVMIFGTAGAERMRIDASGNVSIGHTTSTGSKFAICDGANAQFQFFPEISTDTNLTQHYDPTASAYMTSETRAASHSWKIGTDLKMTLDSSGNVGIGTSTPNSAGLGANGQTLQLGARTFIATDSSGDTRLGGLSGSNITAFYQNGTEAMRIASGGAIQLSAASGVSSVISRTTAPAGSQGLNITGGVVTSLPVTTPTFADNSSSGATIYLAGNSVDAYGGNLLLFAYGSGSTDANIISFHNRSGVGTTKETMRIDTSGNLLLGTTVSPSSPVASHGYLSLSSVKQEGSNSKTITTTVQSITRPSGIGGMAMVTYYNLSGGAQQTDFVIWTSSGASVASTTGTSGLTATYGVNTGALTMVLASGSAGAVVFAITS